MQKVEEMFAFTFSWTVYLSCYGRSDETAFAGEHQSSETPTMCAYGCLPLQTNGGAVAAGTLLSRDSCSGRHETGTKAGEYGEPPFRRDSRNRWQPEENEMSFCTRRPPCPESKIPRASGWQIAEQVSLLFLLKLKSVISALSILGQTFSWSREHIEAYGGSTLLSRLVFRWIKDQERMATHYVLRCHYSSERLSPGEKDILFRGGNTRILAIHNWPVLFQ